MMEGKTEVRAFREPMYMDCISLYISNTFNRGSGRQVGIAETVKFNLVDEKQLGMSLLEPTLRLKPDEAQVLMDELWNAGVRPTKGAGSVGQMEATEKHLNDMRDLVFKKK